MTDSVRRLWHDARRTFSLDRLRPLWMPGLMTLAVAFLLVGLLSWQLPYGNLLLLKAGEIASVTAVAPRGLTYESELLTEQMREHAAQQAPDQYDNQELLVRREQVRLAREISARHHRDPRRPRGVARRQDGPTAGHPRCQPGRRGCGEGAFPHRRTVGACPGGSAGRPRPGHARRDPGDHPRCSPPPRPYLCQHCAGRRRDRRRRGARQQPGASQQPPQ